MKRVVTIAFLLAFVGGYADAVSYLLTGSFTGHLTGNAVLLAIHLARASWREAAANALAIVAFAVGIVVAEWTTAHAGKPTLARQLCVPLLIEGALLAAALGSRFVDGWVGNELCVVCLCLMLGQQNGALRRCGSLSVRTTFITGLSTTLLSTTVERATGQESPNDRSKRQPWTVAGLLVFFAAGALAGAWAEGVWKNWSLAGMFAPLVAGLLLAAGSREEA